MTIGGSRSLSLNLWDFTFITEMCRKERNGKRGKHGQWISPRDSTIPGLIHSYREVREGENRSWDDKHTIWWRINKIGGGDYWRSPPTEETLHWGDWKTTGKYYFNTVSVTPQIELFSHFWRSNINIVTVCDPFTNARSSLPYLGMRKIGARLIWLHWTPGANFFLIKWKGVHFRCTTTTLCRGHMLKIAQLNSKWPK